MVLGSTDVHLETSHVTIVARVELITTDVDELLIGEEVMDTNELLLNLTTLEGDLGECTTMLTLVQEVDVMPLGDLILVGDRLVHVWVTSSLQTIIRVG